MARDPVFSWSGYEQKVHPAAEHSQRAIELMVSILRDISPVFTSMVLWECKQPWRVDERRLCDNLLLFVLKGEEEISIGDETRRLKTGDIAMIPEFTRHRLAIAPGCSKCRHFIAHFSIKNPLFINPFTGFESFFMHSSHPEADLDELPLVSSVARISLPAAAKLMHGVLYRLLTNEIIAGRYHLPEERVKDQRILKAISFMQQNYQQNISMRQIAAAAGLGEVRFRNLFKQETQTPPSVYLLRLRVANAAREIIVKNCSLKEAAFSCGFTNLPYFCVAFRRIMHVTPAVYRQNFLLA